MKKSTLALIIAFMALIVGGFALGIQLTEPGYPEAQPVTDSVVVVNNYDVFNPTFTSVEEVLKYQEDRWNYDSVDSIFMSIPPNILEMAAKVQIGQLGRATKKQIVIEYLQHHQDIYKYITQEDSTQLPPARAVTEILQSADTADTVINGKPYKLLTN